MSEAGTGILLVVEDDPDDQEFVQYAADKIKLPVKITFFNDGIELMDYLNQKDGRDQAPAGAKVVLLDLNMPRKDGKEVLREIKSSPSLKDLQVVILTTSDYDRDRQITSELGASGFITKPVHLEDWVRILRFIYQRWFQ